MSAKPAYAPSVAGRQTGETALASSTRIARIVAVSGSQAVAIIDAQARERNEGRIEIDLDKRIGRRVGQIVALSRTEWLLLQYLAANAGRVMLNNQVLSNVGGTVQASSGMTVSAATLDNTGGYLKGTGSQALSVTTTGALTNAVAGGTGGFLGGNGVVTVHAGSLRNAGQIYAGSALTVASQGTLVNDGGALQAMSALNVSAISSLSNRNGRIAGGAGDSAATLAVSAGSIDNTGGRVANAGHGVSTIGTGGSIVNRGGTLGGQGNATLNATSLDNSQSGHVVAGQSLTLGLGGMNNAAGTL